MLERAEGLHRQFFQPGFAGTQAACWEPPVDIFETERELWIIAALPGVESQDIAISIEGQVLVSPDCAACRRRRAAQPSTGWKSPTADSSAASACRLRASSSIDRSSPAVASSSV